MPADLEAEETAELRVKTPVPPQLARYVFQPGHQALRGGGRPKGMLNAATILEKSTPRIAKQYVKRALQSDPVLIDAMKRILPVTDADVSSPAPTVVIVFQDIPHPVVAISLKNDAVTLPVSVDQL